MTNKRMSGGKPSDEKRRRQTKPDADNATRMLTKKVKTARGRKISSKLWIERQINDPYVQKAKELGYRSRAAFKLEELDDKYKLVGRDALIVDLGCAPGGWMQAAFKRGAKRIVGIDILPVEAVPNAEILHFDFMAEDAPDRLKAHLDRAPDLVMSDLAANTTGHKQTDHLKTVALVEAAAEFAMDVLKPGGHFVTKVFQGGTEEQLLKRLKDQFEFVRHAKPASSRKGSPEIYLVAKGFIGPQGGPDSL
ncbi:RlmE family RNA methyltransferase [Algimonas porphyrae]|uniref:Ribosomal RNA large subunit methyltransferase E n=1 Tax=Algimonas porphyrae TaxID=1128113 RepID=A0ABQ5UV82_9PROT|nr:RlmE family RNA methyltransferase [Algimonas porphyrae]GLQ19066.1 ribosomal RNA large subunit methyltransferase E [Algimonas porphyrae]